MIKVTNLNKIFHHKGKAIGASGTVTSVAASGLGLNPTTITNAGTISLDIPYFASTYVKKSGDVMTGNYSITAGSLTVGGGFRFFEGEGELLDSARQMLDALSSEEWDFAGSL
jgi:hypothetical protein